MREGFLRGSCFTKRVQDKNLVKGAASCTISGLVTIQWGVLLEAVRHYCEGQPRRWRKYGNSTAVFRTQRFPILWYWG